MLEKKKLNDLEIAVKNLNETVAYQEELLIARLEDINLLQRRFDSEVLKLGKAVSTLNSRLRLLYSRVLLILMDQTKYNRDVKNTNEVMDKKLFEHFKHLETLFKNMSARDPQHRTNEETENDIDATKGAGSF